MTVTCGAAGKAKGFHAFSAEPQDGEPCSCGVLRWRVSTCPTCRRAWERGERVVEGETE